MDAKLKTFLKVAAAVVVPGAAVVLAASWLLKNSEKEAFKKYIRKTYGDQSNYVDLYY